MSSIVHFPRSMGKYSISTLLSVLLSQTTNKLQIEISKSIPAAIKLLHDKQIVQLQVSVFHTHFFIIL